MVEFSIITFMFIIVLLGVVELSRLALAYATMANASRIGARYAIVHGSFRTGTGVDGPSGPGSTTQVETVVQNFVRIGLLDTSRLTISVTYPDSNNNPGSRVLVTVSYPFDPLLRYFNSMLGVTLGSSSEGVITF